MDSPQISPTVDAFAHRNAGSFEEAALRLCVPEGGDTWPLPGPCKQIAEQLRLKSLEEIDADEL